MLTRREGQILGYNATTGNLQVPSSKTVVVNKSGGLVNGTQLGSVLNLHQGHGFAVNDYFINFDAADREAMLWRVTVVAATQITFTGGAATFTDGSRLVNLGSSESGSGGAVAYDGSDKEIWTDYNGADDITESTITPDATTGRYGYWFHGEAWELVLDSSSLAESLIIVSDGKRKRTAVSTTYQATPSDDIIANTATGTPYTITLPAVATVPVGFVLTVVDEGGAATSDNITVKGSGSELINGANTFVLNANYESITVYSNGTKWLVIAHYAG